MFRCRLKAFNIKCVWRNCYTVLFFKTACSQASFTTLTAVGSTSLLCSESTQRHAANVANTLHTWTGRSSVIPSWPLVRLYLLSVFSPLRSERRSLLASASDNSWPLTPSSPARWQEDALWAVTMPRGAAWAEHTVINHYRNWLNGLGGFVFSAANQKVTDRRGAEVRTAGSPDDTAVTEGALENGENKTAMSTTGLSMYSDHCRQQWGSAVCAKEGKH